MTIDKWLFTPGPLTTSRTIKAAQLHDLGSRDENFIATVKAIRERLLALAGQPDDTHYTAIPMQGSGTFGVESVISTAIPHDGKLLNIINGAYGRRIQQMTDIHNIATCTLTYPENTQPDPAEIAATLSDNPDITHVAVVHCETTTGILNPLAEIAAVVRQHGRKLIVDAMSSFGAIPIDVADLGIAYLVSSANKCIEGLPGFSFVIAEIAALEQTAGSTRSLSLDLHDQWRVLQKTGQFRYTPAVQSMLAFHQALIELEQEGGLTGRAKRYQENHRVLNNGLQALGLKPYLDPAVQSIIITTYHYPDHPAFNFHTFYEKLSQRGYVIYPGKLTEANCFRVGNIGRLYPEQMEELTLAVQTVLGEMGVTL